uniref:Malonyl-CoA:ACP transacylase (MAT) domain-containing protein n=1 Tax=Panagrolaimus sp. PS1159 TaxID=55785 RepID=A0AC35FIK9_9BILA
MLKLFNPFSVSSPKLLFTRNVRRRGPPADFHPPPKEADFLKDATTYSDVHSAILDPHSSLPYPAEQLQDYLHNKEKEQQRSVRSQEYKKGRKIIKLNFDHIPIEDQVVALFPGQGAQHLKMGEKVIDCPSSKALFDQANEILGYDLLKICMDGPKTKLDQTIYCQPAVFVASLAAYEKLKTEQTDLEDRLTDAAGFSVGEYAALVAGGVMKFEDALKVVKIRAEAMHECNQIVSAGMLTIRVNASSKLDEALKAACEDAMESDEVPVCEVANYLFQGVKVIGGTNRCLTFLESNAQRFKIQPIKRLAVSGAFHTRLMANAMEKVQHAFTGMQFEQSTCNIYSNYTGKIHSRKAGEIRKALIQQVAEPVKWEQIQQLLFRKHQDFKFPNYIEIGPGRQLGSMLVNISKKAYQAYTNYPC